MTRPLTATDLTANRMGLVAEMLSTYSGTDPYLVSMADVVRNRPNALTTEMALTIVNTPRTPMAARPTIISGTYTIVNPKTGGYRTIKIADPKDGYWKNLRPGTRIASYLMGSDNETDFVGFAFVSPDGTAKVWKSAIGMTAQIAALNWLLVNGAGHEIELGKAYAVRSGRCAFCNRKLTTPASVASGYGPDCAEKNGLPWAAPTPSAKTSAQVGWQTVTTNPVSVGDGTTTADAPKTRRSYTDLFPSCSVDGCDEDAMRAGGTCADHRSAKVSA